MTAEIIPLLRKRKARQAELDAAIGEAKARAASPLTVAWDETKTLLGLLDSTDDPEDVRRRLRPALPSVVDAINLVVVSRGRDRYLWAQAVFTGGGRYRNLLIAHRPPRPNGVARAEGQTFVFSLVHPDAFRAGITVCIDDVRDGLERDNVLACLNEKDAFGTLRDFPAQCLGSITRDNLIRWSGEEGPDGTTTITIEMTAD